MQKTELMLVAAILIALAFAIGYQMNSNSSRPSPTAIDTLAPTENPSLGPTPSPVVETNVFGPGETKMFTIPLPAVDRDNKGVLTSLNVEAREGNGKIYIDYSGGAPLLGSETQNSILNAVEVAKKITGRTLSRTNLYYSFATDAQEVGGASAGAATAIATAALLEGKKIRKGFLITGSIDGEGNIGEVGRIFEKAQAAKKGGYTTFLVPSGEAETQVAVEKCTEKQTQTSVIKSCTTEYELKSVEDLAGINVVEVDDVRQAYNLMAG